MISDDQATVALAKDLLGRDPGIEELRRALRFIRDQAQERLNNAIRQSNQEREREAQAVPEVKKV